MKFSTISMILCLVAGSTAFPTVDEYQISESRGSRQKRLTCDLLSFMGDSACAANCISMGKAGGSCSGGICYCRQDSFSEVWNRRMSVTQKNPPETPQEFLDRYNARRNNN